MNARFFSLVLFAGSLIPFSVSAQCTAPCVLEEARFGTMLDYRLAKALVHEEKRLWSRVRLGTAVVDASQASLADQRVVPWPANDPLQPRLQVIKAKLLLYDDPDPSKGKWFFGGARVTRGAGLRQEFRGGFIVGFIYEKPL
jgi:hypothetical protein